MAHEPMIVLSSLPNILGGSRHAKARFNKNQMRYELQIIE